MKLLLDQNLSYKLKTVLADLYCETAHVRELNLDRASDIEIWRFARTHGYCIVSKDKDFLQRSLLAPAPKLLWIALGNCSTAAIEGALMQRTAELQSFLEDPVLSVLVIR